MTYQFPKDERFRKLAAKLADAVQLAIWRGKNVSISSGGGSRCPMGCLPNLPSTRPSASMAANALECDWGEAWAFICGFDGLHSDHTCVNLRPWVHLGLAYRERFR